MNVNKVSRIFFKILPDFILVQAIFISLIASKSSFIDDLAKFILTLDEMCTLLKDYKVLKQLVFHPWQTSVMWFSGPLDFSFRAKFRSNPNETCQKQPKNQISSREHFFSQDFGRCLKATGVCECNGFRSLARERERLYSLRGEISSPRSCVT